MGQRALRNPNFSALPLKWLILSKSEDSAMCIRPCRAPCASIMTSES